MPILISAQSLVFLSIVHHCFETTSCLSSYHYQDETEHTADISALKRSVPREQGSRFRHSRPKGSAAPASRLHTAMSEMVGSEGSEGNSGWWQGGGLCSSVVSRLTLALHAAVTPHATVALLRIHTWCQSCGELGR